MEMDDRENDKEDRSFESPGVANAVLIQNFDAAIQLVVTAAFELHLNMSQSQLGGAWGNEADSHSECVMMWPHCVDV